MVGKPEIVIAEMRNVVAACKREHGVTVPLAVAFALFEIEDAYPRIADGQGACAGGCLRRAVAHHEQLEIAMALPKHGFYRERKQRRLLMDAQQNGEAGG